MCIEIFGLNVRDQLVRERQGACREARALVWEWISSRSRRDVVGSELKAMHQGERPHTMAARAVFADLRPLFADLGGRGV